MSYNEFFNKGKELGFTDIELVIKEGISSDIKISNDEVIYYQNDGGSSYEIKAIINDHCVEMVSDYLDIDILYLLKEKASVVEDKYKVDLLNNSSINNTIDYNLDYENINSIIDKLLTYNNLRSNIVNKVISYFSYSKSIKRIINTNGVDIITPSTTYKVYMQLVNENNDRTTQVGESILVSSIDKFDFDKLFNSLNKELSYKLEENSITSGKYNVIIKNDVLSILIGKMLGALNIESICENTSFFKDLKDTKVFSDKLSIIEDPLNKECPGYTLFDDEGTLTSYKEIITNGVLNTYIYDNKNASKYNTISTGNRYSNSIGFRNTYIKEGNKSFDELLLKLGNGIIIDECMGYHASIKLNNGDISLQAFGLIVEDGKIISSFIPVVMTTNYKELFSSIDEIGSDLKFYSMSFGSPSILFNNISIASK